MRDIQLGKARLIVPQGYLDSSAGARAPCSTPTGRSTPRSRRSAARVLRISRRTSSRSAGWSTRRPIEKTISEIVRRAGYSSQDFGEEPEAVAMTATEIEARERRSLITRDKKILYWRPALRDALYGLLSVQRTMFGDTSRHPGAAGHQLRRGRPPGPARGGADRCRARRRRGRVEAGAGADGAPGLDAGRGRRGSGADPHRDRAGRAGPCPDLAEGAGHGAAGADIADIAGLVPAAPIPADVPGERENTGGDTPPGA